jgi:hypothetical protein
MSVNKFEIIVIYNGVPQTLEVNENQALQAVFQHALQLFQLQHAPGNLGLADMNNNPLNLGQSVKDAGIAAGTRVQLRAPAGGG